MDRAVTRALLDWAKSDRRKPLVLRGARQVGKTWLVRELARSLALDLVEINFERDPQTRVDFRSNNPREVLGQLGLRRNAEISPETSMLFLDEIQEAPEVYGKLRWFAEELPELAVIGAGSLLEFALGEAPFHAPVGRIGYRHIEPLGWSEFLHGHGQGRLLSLLGQWSPGHTIAAGTHEAGLRWQDRYMQVGGMPEVVALDVAGHTPAQCRAAQRDLVATYRDDFAKYKGRLPKDAIEATLMGAAQMIGQKFVYANVTDVGQGHAKQALALLTTARLCHEVVHAHAHGLPLAGDTKPSMRKVILLDVGIVHALMGTQALSAFPSFDSLAPRTRGQLTEQMVGQALRLLIHQDADGPQLHYWQREGGRAGEVDYLFEDDGGIVPLELKAGSAGSMKSLHQFMADRALLLAVRVDRNPPSFLEVDVRTTQGDSARYGLLSLPFYLLHRLPELTERVRAKKVVKRR
jgi:uncharacterized protein